MTNLLSAGDVLTDPISGASAQLLELRSDGFLLEQSVPANLPKNMLYHVHTSWSETFDIISGTGRYKLAGVEYDATPGHQFVVQPGQAHIHPWNTGNTELRFRQSDTFSPPDATAAVDTFLAFSTMFGLAREGKTGKDGIPKNPLQLLVILNFFRQHGGYLAGLPIPLQDVLMTGGARLGRMFGYKEWYEQYLPSQLTKTN